MGHVVQPRRDGFAANALQRIVQKMRVDLVLQRQILRLPFGCADQVICRQKLAQLVKRRFGGGADRVAQLGNALQRVPARKQLHHLFCFAKRRRQKMAQHRKQQQKHGHRRQQYKQRPPLANAAHPQQHQ
ncbi:hypothetical protein SDC9_199344 [bioreactor metagenome]|uniref:Uncharacterized protein n=1 Tax=bioreactor metagenome TaxID=1076179 RepID=A0A645IK62_9ZZZZ